jgi:hypothetical protein
MDAKLSEFLFLTIVRFQQPRVHVKLMVGPANLYVNQCIILFGLVTVVTHWHIFIAYKIIFLLYADWIDFSREVKLPMMDFILMHKQSWPQFTKCLLVN